MSQVIIPKQWSNQEINLLQSLFPKNKSKKWKVLLQQFQKRGFIRSERQLKIKWKYIIDTSNDHKKWTFQQLKNLYESVYLQGSNWSTIRKRLRGRSCMKLKNTFYSSMRKFVKKFFEQIFQNQKFYNFKTMQLLPHKCLKLFCGQEQFIEMNNLILEAFRKFDYNFSQEKFEQFKNNNTQLYNNISQLLKQNYEKIFVFEIKQIEDGKILENNIVQIQKISQIINLTESSLDKNNINHLNNSNYTTKKINKQQQKQQNEKIKYYSKIRATYKQIDKVKKIIQQNKQNQELNFERKYPSEILQQQNIFRQFNENYQRQTNLSNINYSHYYYMFYPYNYE